MTSGNTGIGFAAVAASRDYRAKFCLSDNISPDKVMILRLCGAEVVTHQRDARQRDLVLAAMRFIRLAGCLTSPAWRSICCWANLEANR
ncbi:MULTISPECIES: pyridoxal-phosphate dependent enzyme [unclassified Mesorhizobium]|uniref:pyridoxal-phosphate dependent enzyme n=1 Tax=unclassified Mesorhizobium TaxID=325217 RepID=UPI001FDFF976|nr:MULTISPECIES: pyridoxal-phosphate dependent enzyme [unclassified Mesorhizobium]